LNWDLFVIQIVNGLQMGMVLALVACGLTLIFGIMDVVNFAHGELYMLGAYIAYYAIILLGNFWVALAVAMVLVFFIGVLMYQGTIRPILGRDPLYTLLATFGVSLVLQQLALWLFGPIAKGMDAPISYRFNLLGFDYPFYRIMVAMISGAIILGLITFLRKTRYGLWIRATTQDGEMAGAMGIPVPVVLTMVFGLGSALAAVSGVLVGPLYGGIAATMGLDIILYAFIVVVIGGMGSLKGSIVAGIFIGELESISSVWVNPTQAKILSFVALIVIFLVRPAGIFAQQGKQ